MKKRKAFTLIELLTPNRRFGRGVRKNGFTLIELLIVISIIGVLITLVAVTVRPIQTKSRDAKRKSDLNLYLSALDLFKTDFKIYPNHTFYLGKNTTDTGALVSSLDLANDIASCQGLTGGGNPTNFAITPASLGAPTGGPFVPTTDYDNAILKPGFAATNHFLMCLKYIDRIVVDAVHGTTRTGYNFTVAYDYVDVLVSGQLENANDQDAKTLFNATVPRRYYIGSGATVRHLDDDSDSDSTAGVNANFFTAFGGIRPITNGKYLYQCNGRAAAQDIKRDDRSLTANQPLVFQGGSWVANPLCLNSDAALDDVQAW